MFTLASGFYESYLVPPEVSILIIGLDNAGKTTLLERLKVTDLKNGSSPGKRISMKPIGRVDDSHKKVNRNSGSNCKDRSSDVGQNVIKIFDNDQEMKKTSAEDKKSHTLHKDEMVIAKSEINKSANVLCPSPKVYHLSRENDDALLESNELLSDPKTNKQDNNNGIVQLPPNTNHEGTTIMSPPTIVPSTTRDRQQNNGHQSKDRDIKHHELELEYDLKKGAKMLPSRLIRKTLGMNLAKFECKYAKVRLMDLGGSIQMRNIWEKYYNDVHGVIYVVDVSKHSPVSKLMESRAYYRCMLDDESLQNVPILIFANKVDDRETYGQQINGIDMNSEINDVYMNKNDSIVNDQEELEEMKQGISKGNDGGILGDTSLLDIAELFLSPPRGSPTNNINLDNIAMFAGSAKSGLGVRPALEWLIQMSTYLLRAKKQASSSVN